MPRRVAVGEGNGSAKVRAASTIRLERHDEDQVAVSSMTGFARADGAADGLTWAWEARSVNGRGLDCRLRLPPGHDALEAPIRDAVVKRFARGNVSINLALDRQGSAGTVRLNEQVLADIIKAADRVVALTGGDRPDTAALLGMRGVLEISDTVIETDDQRRLREQMLLASLGSVLDGLAVARRAEGVKLEKILTDQVAQVERIVRDVRASPSRGAEAIRTRLAELVARILETSEGFDADRLHQEAVLAATRADVEEELARLEAHIVSAREIMGETGAIGRKLDFLAQEFNREANTLCSKANAVDITRLGLALKSVIDQFREQVQNVE